MNTPARKTIAYIAILITTALLIPSAAFAWNNWNERVFVTYETESNSVEPVEGATVTVNYQVSNDGINWFPTTPLSTSDITDSSGRIDFVISRNYNTVNYNQLKATVTITKTDFPDYFYTSPNKYWNFVGEEDETFRYTIKKDLDEPNTWVSALPAETHSRNFTVSWSGNDPMIFFVGGGGGAGSGIKSNSFLIQYKDGSGGTWTDWKTASAQGSDTFTGEDGHTYYFRSRATDNNDNVEEWPTGPDYDTYTTILLTHLSVYVYMDDTFDNPADGVSVSLYESSGALFDTQTTDALGNCSFDYDMGEVAGKDIYYQVSSTVPPRTKRYPGNPSEYYYVTNGVTETHRLFNFMGGSISGTVNVQGEPDDSGVIITINGASVNESITTLADGKYGFYDLPQGQYTLTASKTGWTFTPSWGSNTVTINSDLTGYNFNSSLTQYKVSGTLSVYLYTNYVGSPLDPSGATVTFVTNKGGYETKAPNSDGSFVFENITSNTICTITPSYADVNGYPCFFYPYTQTITVEASNVTLPEPFIGMIDIPGPDPDYIAPGTISTLTVTNTTANSITLSWTAPADDGYNVSSGNASSYDIRMSDSNITTASFAGLTLVSGLPLPSAPGTTQTFTFTGLNPNTQYYFAMKTKDEVPNTSQMSNVTNGTTANIVQNTGNIEVFTIANDGSGGSVPVQAEFTITDGTGAVVFNDITDASGNWETTSVPVGTYTITYEVLAGYDSIVPQTQTIATNGQTITFTATYGFDDTTPPNNFTLSLNSINGHDVSLSWTEAIDPTPGTGIREYVLNITGLANTYNFNSSARGTALSLPDGSYNAKVTAIDYAGNSRDSNTVSITVNAEAPEISVTIGNNSQVYTEDRIAAPIPVSTGSIINLSASDGNGIAYTSITLKDIAGNTISSGAGLSASSLTLENSLNMNETYIIEASATDNMDSERTITLYIQIVPSGVHVINGNPYNFPNPFDPEIGTTIRYFLSNDGEIKLAIYNSNGKPVINMVFYPGKVGGKQDINDVVWDGTDMFGNTAANGPYLYFIINEGKILGKGNMTGLK